MTEYLLLAVAAFLAGMLNTVAGGGTYLTFPALVYTGVPLVAANATAPFAGPEAVLAYLSRYTHRVTISNRRLIAFDESRVTFRYKDYRHDGVDRQQVMTLGPDEFIRRFLLHVLPRGFHRIRHYGLLAGSARKASLALARELLDVAAPPDDDTLDDPENFRPPCPCCGGRMIIIEMFERWRQPRGPPDATFMLQRAVAYYRVSTQRQGRSGLGIEAQRARGLRSSPRPKASN